MYDTFFQVKHEYLRSRAYICLSLSSSSSSGDISLKSWTIEILVLTSWIPASKNFVDHFYFFRNAQNYVNLMEVSFHKTRLRLELPLDTLKKGHFAKTKKSCRKTPSKIFCIRESCGFGTKNGRVRVVIILQCFYKIPKRKTIHVPCLFQMK